MMKILIASRFKYPNIGGVSAYISQLKHGLERKGHKVDLLARHSISRFFLNEHHHSFDSRKLQYKLKPEIQKRISQLARLDPYFRQVETDRHIYGDVALAFGLEQYDVIYAQDIQTAYALSFVKPKKTPLIGMIHGTPIYNRLLAGEINSDSQVYKFSVNYESKAIRSCDLWIVPSEWMKNFMVETFKVAANKLMVVPHGMDIEQFEAKMDEAVHFPHDPKKTVIVCPARLTKVKGHEHLLEALAKLKDTPHWVCWLIGDGHLEKELKTQVETLGLKDHVVFLGYQNNVPALLKRADIVVLSSLQENQPFAVMEAQLAGKPIVATAVGGIPEMIQDKKTGLLAPAKSAEGLYTNLKRLVNHKALRNSLGTNGQEWAMKKWNLNRMIDETISVFQEQLHS
ncbi:glycosyltransferase involved in cell wall biosynthesis [Pullulanibacillus pueri]|uniref:Uncharacterized protein n=1 Tax=Pullulanibacillus pueri TaxID=1437324 RepID=A0A8J3EM75_9BACL|nr:glycosyltransferase family 4 protein [Pullulanibacillus pueri]MBM7680961.1 glycosyltransferase involved in cell wall biosynthesis [Pullulanibacillus pueri]GGH81501.1 hypothetical protein GCM10007096_19500 [Pullulanibacillus pueri]